MGHNGRKKMGNIHANRRVYKKEISQIHRSNFGNDGGVGGGHISPKFNNILVKIIKFKVGRGGRLSAATASYLWAANETHA